MIGVSARVKNIGESTLSKKIKIKTNCDCGSGSIERYERAWKYGPRCPYCNKILGPMQWNIGKEGE